MKWKGENHRRGDGRKGLGCNYTIGVLKLLIDLQQIML
jgi:hypothetical protein